MHILSRNPGLQTPAADIARHNQIAAVGCEWLHLRFKVGRDNVIMCAATVGPHDVIASIECQLVLVRTNRRERRGESFSLVGLCSSVLPGKSVCKITTIDVQSE